MISFFFFLRFLLNNDFCNRTICWLNFKKLNNSLTFNWRVVIFLFFCSVSFLNFIVKINWLHTKWLLICGFQVYIKISVKHSPIIDQVRFYFHDDSHDNNIVYAPGLITVSLQLSMPRHIVLGILKWLKYKTIIIDVSLLFRLKTKKKK